MRRTFLLLVGAAILALPAVAAARAQSHAPSRPPSHGPSHASSHRPAHGFLVVHNALNDAGPVATIAVQGFVIGRIRQEGAVKIFQFGPGEAAQVSGVDVRRQPVTYQTQQGTKFSGSDFRFRAVGGFWRVVVYGAGISLYAGGRGTAFLHGSVFSPHTDGQYSFNGAPFASLPSGVVKGTLGAK